MKKGAAVLEKKPVDENRKQPEAKSLHGGHRERVKSQFLKNGLDSFQPHSILELLLYYAIPLKDTNPIAHQLLQKFGSLSGTFDAPYEELLKVDGIGRSAATLIKLIPQICRRYQEDIDRDKIVIYSYDEAGKRLVNKFIGRQNEVVVLMLLDSKTRILFCDVVDEGSVNSANIYIKKIVRLSVQYDASYAILSHNHPSGSCLPSKQDLSTTRWVYEALDTVEVRLIDHIIVSGNDYLSIAQSKLMPELFNSELE
ncbi:DNA repair protein RadC [Caproiciproducens sp. NJN-50]|uniref:JAB domain-containing protein n=1 Tax=Acutalibacteraceae TaxID=3082771 RepID=UPI000FFE1678|nr:MULTISPECIES: DNA repair protein RadC [Acutalibacteraceae]QAT49735.1 DNA repair protein RadC [Caproiciproducens sp. NJN-50]